MDERQKKAMLGFLISPAVKVAPMKMTSSRNKAGRISSIRIEQIGEHLCRGASNVLGLDTLGGDSKDGFSHPLDFSIHRSLPRQHNDHKLELQELFSEVN